MTKIKLLHYFLKEEIRLHTNLYKSKYFFSYPLILFLFFTGITASSIFLYEQYNSEKIGIALLHLFFIGGVMSGAFGLYARDFLERKFGDIGKLFSNTLILPIKLKTTFIIYALSDSFFYLFWFIIPTIAGFGLGNLILGEPIGFILYLALSVFIIFMLGLFSMFFLSVIFERNKILFSILLIIITSLSITLYMIVSIESLLIYNFFITGNILNLLYTIGIIILLAFLSYISINENYYSNKKINKKTKSLSFPKNTNPHIFKDFIDLNRTGGIIGKPLLIVIIPSILLLLLFSTIEFLKDLKLDLIFFSIIFGTLGTQLLNSLISSDNFRYYRYLPVTLKNYIISKIKLSFIICFLIGFIILILHSLYTKEFNLLIISTIILAILLIYNFTLSFFLTGLNPYENLMQSKIFIQYFILFVPILLASMTINVLFNNFLYFLFYFIFFSIISFIYLYLGIKKWENKISEII